MHPDFEAFQIAIPEEEIGALRQRLAAARLPDQIEGTGWDYGMPTDELRRWLEYWRREYDWRIHERRLNGFENFRTRIDGQTIHFLRARSPRPDALPLLLLHGWPGSVVEFLDVLPRLTDPTSFGGEADQAFEVVVPSLPGYGFSGPTHAPGWDVHRIARAFRELLHRLGWRRYGLQGGDWGAQIATRMAPLDPEGCVGLHLNLALGRKPDDPGPLSAEEKTDLAAMARFARDESGYALLQGTRPQTLGVALNDSPAGLLAWILEKFHAWSDGDRPLEQTFDRDLLLTNVSIYWLTRTATSSARLYRECRERGLWEETPDYVAVPTGVARYPGETVLRYPRPWVEAQYNVTHWSVLPRGGHFAAMEQPELFARDVATFFGTVR